MEKFDSPKLSITDTMAGHARWHADKTAVICGDVRLSWRDFTEGINKTANALVGMGLKKGDKVSILSGNNVEMAQVIYGTVKAGGVIVPLSAMATPEGIAMMINDSDSVVLFADTLMAIVIAPHLDKLKNIRPDGLISIGFEEDGWTPYEKFISDAPDTEPEVKLGHDDEFNIIYSSGTTGDPKGIVHTHWARAEPSLGLGVEFRIDSSSISILTTPLYHNGTWMIMLPTLLAGGTIVIMEKFDSKAFLETVQKEKCTHTFMVPTQFILIMNLEDFEEYDVSSMKIMVSAGAPLRKDTKEQILKRFTRGLLEVYGLTEGIGTTLKPEEMEGKIGSVGTPIFGVDIKIINDEGDEISRGEVGEIVGYSPGLLKEYYKKPDKTAGAIWKDRQGRTYLKTGDVGKIDEEGFLYILDRKKDMIISGGINIFATDIEEIIAGHPDVLDVTVIGVPHEKWGESPLALVIPKSGTSPSEEEIREWANAKLAKFQKVSAVELREQFPRNPIGKVLKRVLREPYLKDEKIN